MPKKSTESSEPQKRVQQENLRQGPSPSERQNPLAHPASRRSRATSQFRTSTASCPRASTTQRKLRTSSRSSRTSKLTSSTPKRSRLTSSESKTRRRPSPRMPAWTSWTTRCACTSSRWARCPCSPASKRSPSPSGSKRPSKRPPTYSSPSGLTTLYQIDLAKKLIDREERFDRVVLDKKIDSRENYFKSLPKQIELAEAAEAKCERAWADIQKHEDDSPNQKRAKTRLSKYEGSLKPIFRKFCFKLKVFEEFLDNLSPTLREIEDHLEHLKLANKVKSSRHRKHDPETIRKAPRRHQADVPHRARGAAQPRPRGPQKTCEPPTAPRRRWSRVTCAWSFPSPRSTPTAASPSSTSSRRATWA